MGVMRALGVGRARERRRQRAQSVEDALMGAHLCLNQARLSLDRGNTTRAEICVRLADEHVVQGLDVLHPQPERPT